MVRKMIGPILFGLVGCAILLALGVWQVQRLDWKQGLLAEIEARIAALRDAARDAGVVCVFGEPQFGGERVSAIFGDTVGHGVLDPLGSRHAPGPALYPALIGDMAAALETCLGTGG